MMPSPCCPNGAIRHNVTSKSASVLADFEAGDYKILSPYLQISELTAPALTTTPLEAIG